MNIPKTAPHTLHLERLGNGGVLLHLNVDRGLRFWLPRHVVVQVDQEGAIWLYQTVHKFMGRPHEENPINVAAALAELAALKRNVETMVSQEIEVALASIASRLGRDDL